MKSLTTASFRKAYAKLPEDVKARTRTAYRAWLSDPFSPGLQYRCVHPTEPVYSVRIGLHYRAVALVEHEVATWFWIGSHSDYDRLLRSL